MKTHTLYTAIFTAVLGALVFSCQSGQKAPETESMDADPNLLRVTKTQFQTNHMALEPGTLRAFPEVLRLNGVLDVPPENRAVVSALSGGFVKRISLIEGNRVQKGDWIATLENPEFLKLQQAYLEVRESLPYLEAEFTRQQTLFQEKISSEKSFLQAEAQYKTALAQLKSYQGQLRLLHIPIAEVEAGNLQSESPVYAPIGGAVSRVSVRKGAYVSQASEIVEIVDPSHLHLELKAFEKDVAGLRIGQRILFELPERSKQQLEAEVYLIGGSLDENRTVRVHAHLKDDHREGLLVGMYVRAMVFLDADTPSEPMAAVPESAVVETSEGHVILVLEEETEDGYLLRRTVVETGRTQEGFTEIRSPGTWDGQKPVLARGGFSLVSPE